MAVFEGKRNVLRGVGGLSRPGIITTPAKEPTDELPPQKGALQRAAAKPEAMHYNRLILLTIVANVVIWQLAVNQGLWMTENGVNLVTLSNFVIGNFFLAIVIRQQYVVNLLFKIATSAPTSWPLSIRWVLGKVYHFGGLHVGGAITGTVWFAGFVATLSVRYFGGVGDVPASLIWVTYALLALLLLIVAMASPGFRHKYHDYFEMSHRFGGWASLVLFWVQTIVFVNSQRGDLALGNALLATPGFWLLVGITVSIALPWLRLRKVEVRIENPSNHVALAKFDYGVTPFAGSSTALSRSPLTEWHSFANVPSPGEDGYRLTISRAGDWTGQLIDDMPSHVWVKGIPTAGVGNIDKLFKRVVWIATGSGIGPCLPHLLSQEVPAHLVWSTRNARQTYGDGLVDEILSVQPNAVVWNTDEKGRPDLVKLAYQAYKDFDAEAVIVISNKKLTWQVVYGMESRGIPAYGAIWDS